MEIPIWLEYVAALAEVAAGVFLAIPALRLSKHLLQFEIIQEPKSGNSAELERLRDKYVGAMSRLLAAWDRRDHWMLRAGFSAFIFSAIIKLASLFE